MPCAKPDQVLVLYNADWTEDLDGTAPGQDSLEVARYYVEQHTDPETGKRPYLLGLSSKGAKTSRLNAMRLPEDSRDNTLGLRLKNAPKKAFKRPPHSATHLVAFSKKDLEAADLASLVIRISPTGKEEDAKLAFSDGEPVQGYPIRQTPLGKDLTAYGFADRSRFPDGFTAWVTCQRSKGKGKPLRDYHARFYFPEQFEADLTGPDGVRDDANYLADMAEPIRAFLTDPENRLPDGTPLKEHILYFVVCYGLPKQVEAIYGVARGVRANAGARDDGSSAEQRLALLFHNIRRYHQVKVVPNPRKGNHPPAVIVSRLRLSLVGANPYRHPITHIDRKGAKQEEPVSHPLYGSYAYDARRIPHFTQTVRRALGDRFLYGVTRIDGRHPEIAKAQVDGALYGSRYLTPFLGWFWAGKWAKARLGAEELRYLEFADKPPEDPAPQARGRCLFYFGDFGYGTDAVADPTAPGRPYWRGFYPGSVGYAVRSYLGWELRRNLSQLYTHNSRYPERILDAGATVCMLSGHGAHDTSVTWWDDQVAFHHLLRGYQLGEVFLMSSLYLDWVRSDVGDPLYRPDLHSTSADETPPRVASAEDLRLHLGTADGQYWARLRPAIETTRDEPEMTDIAVTFWRTPKEKHNVSNWRVSRRPEVLLPDLEPASVYHYDVRLTDPYGNRFSSAHAFGDLTFATGPPPDARRMIAKLEYEPPKDGKPSRVDVAALERVSKRPYLTERGEMHIEFTPTDRGWRLFEDRSRRFLCDHRGFQVGGRTVAFVPPLDEKGKPSRHFPWEKGHRYHLVLRWRRDPLVRQAALVAANGEEFLLGSNNRLCWLPVDTEPTLFATNHRCVVHKLTVYDDTRPVPLDPLYPARFDREGFLKADGRAPEGDAEAPSKAPKTAEPEAK
jgi:hypothetical protein